MAFRPLLRYFGGATLAVALLCCAIHSVWATPSGEATSTPTELLAKADQASQNNYPLFVQMLGQLHEIEDRLTPRQQIHLAFLDAQRAQLSGNINETSKIYERILEQTKDPNIRVQTRIRLIALDLSNRNYLQAYTLTNALMSELPHITKAKVRSAALQSITRVKMAQRQYGEALYYANQLNALANSKEQLCSAKGFLAQIKMWDNGTLAESKNEYDEAVDACLSAGMILPVHSLRLDWASLMKDEGHWSQAVAFLNNIAPSILKSGDQMQIASLRVTLAQAYLLQGKLDKAKQSALSALAADGSKAYNWTQQAAYEVLYQVDEKQGNAAEALSMYRKFIDQYKATADDAQAQALAYQMVKQDVLTKKIKVEELSKQNKILQLRQSLDKKSAETSRLYILLLLFVLASIALWAYRTKHSQVRFRHMARQDDLTGAFNRQHFLEQSESVLHRMHKTDGEACLMILDMDHFKRVNDQYGHVSGDTVLKHVASICRGELRASDVFGRLGGEEFGVLMPNCTPQQGKEIGDRIRHALMNAPVTVRDDESLTITTSIGLTSTRRSGYQLKRLMIHADEALYEAKRNGRNQLMIRTG